MAGRERSRRGGLAILLALFTGALGFMLTRPPILQDPAYHVFADSRVVLGVTNGLNVLSNLPFLLVALSGFAILSARPEGFGEPAERLPYYGFFGGVLATAGGSAFYHLAPGGERLFWDRLPMTVVFMSLLAAVVVERLDVATGLRVFPVLVVLGIASIVYARQTGDLRFYVLVQAFPMLALLVLTAFFPSRYTEGNFLFAVVGWYVLAKIFEVLDAQVFATLQAVSGHTLKHLFAALAVAWVGRTLRLRQLLPAAV